MTNAQFVDEPIVETRLNIGKLTLNVATLGPANGRPVLFLHGFPEHWYSWRHQMRAVAAVGYRAIAPDLRGYNLSDKPRGVAQYRMDELVADVLALLDTLKIQKVDLVSHDWGGTVGWFVAARNPERVRSFSSLNSPHPSIFARLLQTRKQLAKSWYMFAFQLPILPELMISRRGFAKKTFVGWAVHPERFGDVDIARLERAIQQPGAATGMLNLYRAAMRKRPLIRDIIKVPTQVIWGEQDQALGIECLDGLDKLVEKLTIHRVPDASHWIQQDTPEKVNALLIDFLAKN